MTSFVRAFVLPSLAAAWALTAPACATDGAASTSSSESSASTTAEPASAPASAPESGPRSAPAEATAGKAEAPVRIDLDAVPIGKDGQYRATLEITALSAVPRAVVRLVVPDGVTLIEGKVERDAGALAEGAQTNLAVTVQAPETGHFVLAGGVDCHMASGVKLHRGAVFTVGEAPTSADAVEPAAVPDAELGGVRMAPVQTPD